MKRGALKALVAAVRRARGAARLVKLDALEEATADVANRRAGVIAACSICSVLPPHAYALSTARDPKSVARGYSALIPERFVGVDRCRVQIRCPECGTGWWLMHDYEYLAGGSEDEEELHRLDWTSRIEALRGAVERGNSIPIKEELVMLERVLDAEVLNAADIDQRAAMQATVDRLREDPSAARDALAPLRRRHRSCPVCALLPDESCPMPELGRWVAPDAWTRDISICSICCRSYRVHYGSEGYTLLRLDPRTSSADDVQLLLNRWPKKARARKRAHPLHFFVHNGLLGAVVDLLDAGESVDTPDDHGWTPLMRAVDLKNADAIALLLGRGADVAAVTIVGETALYLAAERGLDAQITTLLAAGADPSTPCTGPTAESKKKKIDGVRPAGTTPAQAARLEGHTNLADRLDSI
jgi:hypothetical protein